MGFLEGILIAMMQPEQPPAASRRLTREHKTIAAMVSIYCKDIHGCQGAPCPKCQELLNYARVRLERCPFGETKPTCVKCPVHCYHRDQREEVRNIMRYAGPLMLWHHPILALRHLLDARRSVAPVKAPAKAETGP